MHDRLWFVRRFHQEEEEEEEAEESFSLTLQMNFPHDDVDQSDLDPFTKRAVNSEPNNTIAGTRTALHLNFAENRTILVHIHKEPGHRTNRTHTYSDHDQKWNKYTYNKTYNQDRGKNEVGRGQSNGIKIGAMILYIQVHSLYFGCKS